MVILDRTRGYIFFHVPKTAGTSISKALGEEGGVRLTDESDIARRIVEIREREKYTSGKKRGIVAHVRPWQMRKILGVEAYRSFEKVAVVRSPWTRMRSTYRYHRRRPRDRLGPRVRDIVDLSLSEFTVEICKRGFHSISRLLSDREGRLLVDTLLRFESLESDFAEWSDRVIGKPVALPWLNRSPVEKQEPFTEAAIAAIRAHFADDIERFGYSDSPSD